MNKHIVMAVSACVALLSACGGGGNNGETKVHIGAVKVVGASLADSGTFGIKFTVQSSDSQVYTERIAGTYGLGALCPVYTTATGAAPYTTHATCTNYAVAGASVNDYASGGTLPTSEIKQLQDAGAAGFASSDLLIVGEAGANDAATLIGAFLTQLLGTPGAYTNLVSTLLDPAMVAALGASSDGQAQLGVLYMQALADKLVVAVKANAIDKGATRIVMLNTLDVTQTPRFQGALLQITAVAGAAQAAAVQTLANAWVGAYNQRLAADVAPYADKVVVVDFYSNFNDEMAHPAQYGLSNTTDTVCNEVMLQASPPPTPVPPLPYTSSPYVTALSTPAVAYGCTATAASAITPKQSADGTSSWWRHYLYADYFHPTPYGHQLLAQLVAKRLTEAGWL